QGAYSVGCVPQSPKYSRAGSLVTWNRWVPSRSIVYRSPFHWNRMVVPSGDQTGPNSWAVGLLAIRYGVAAPDATSTPYSFASLETSRDLPSGAQWTLLTTSDVTWRSLRPSASAMKTLPASVWPGNPRTNATLEPSGEYAASPSGPFVRRRRSPPSLARTVYRPGRSGWASFQPSHSQRLPSGDQSSHPNSTDDMSSLSVWAPVPSALRISSVVLIRLPSGDQNGDSAAAARTSRRWL